MKVWTPALIVAMVSNWIAHVASGNFDGALRGMYVGLYKNISGSPTPDRVYADLTEANFAGYARVALGTLTGPYFDEAGLVVLLSAALAFHSTDGVTPNTVIGAFLVDAASGSGNLMAMDPFEDSWSFGDAYAGKEYVARFGIPKETTHPAGVPVA